MTDSENQNRSFFMFVLIKVHLLLNVPDFMDDLKKRNNRIQ